MIPELFTKSSGEHLEKLPFDGVGKEGGLILLRNAPKAIQQAISGGMDRVEIRYNGYCWYGCTRTGWVSKKKIVSN
ncbi:hypothetical protein H2Y67_000918 [Escherichia coli]|uniref:hypothetical protein n=1 Tax=Escherichia coli TaxID=562 RepID=UPI000B7EBB1D|nr:hypothetical protein [Escherichia coli]EES9974547.1 hypothetical protein [Escherichia coli]EFS6392734.1 hypothetical protein [Escherichia coli]EJD5602799.1 hypothetical protein [Escherichia coli]EKZ8016457.1 hypothetical protein [Escherichia coli]ELA3518912.1 hypothetical protein [Escherichia coli]